MIPFFTTTKRSPALGGSGQATGLNRPIAHELQATRDGSTAASFDGSSSHDSDLSARLTELAATSSSLDSTHGSEDGLASMLQAAHNVAQLKQMGLGHLAVFANFDSLAATAPTSGSSPLAVVSDTLARTLPLPLRPAELQLPESGSDRSHHSSGDPSPRRQACTPVLRLAKMVSPDEEGVMALIPHEHERPGEYANRQRPW